MIKHLVSFDLDPDKMPLIVQFNKQDLPNALPAPFMQNILNCQNRRTILSVANSGAGVFDTLKAVIAGVVTKIQQETA